MAETRSYSSYSSRPSSYSSYQGSSDELSALRARRRQRDARHRHYRRISGQGESALHPRLRGSRRDRPARRHLQAHRPHQSHLAAHRADRGLHGRRLLSADRPAARGLCVDRPRADEPDDLGRQRATTTIPRSSSSPATCRPISSTPARCRTTIAITATCRRCSRRSCKKSWRIRKVEDLVKALPDAFSLMRTGRPGPVHFDMPYDLYMRTAPVDDARPQCARRAAQLAHDGRRRDGREGAQPADRRAAPADPRRRRRAGQPRLRRAARRSPSSSTFPSTRRSWARARCPTTIACISASRACGANFRRPRRRATPM